MSDIPFKSDNFLASWQYLMLGLFCLAMVVAAVVAKWYAGRKKGRSLFDELKGASDTAPGEVEFSCRNLSRDARLYCLRVDGKKHLIFETEKGLLELEQDDVSNG